MLKGGPFGLLVFPTISTEGTMEVRKPSNRFRNVSRMERSSEVVKPPVEVRQEYAVASLRSERNDPGQRTPKLTCIC